MCYNKVNDCTVVRVLLTSLCDVATTDLTTLDVHIKLFILQKNLFVKVVAWLNEFDIVVRKTRHLVVLLHPFEEVTKK